MQVRDAVTSTFVLASASEIRVYRVFFSGPAQRCVRMLVQGVRGENRPVSCGFELAGCWRSLAVTPLHTHA